MSFETLVIERPVNSTCGDEGENMKTPKFRRPRFVNFI